MSTPSTPARSGAASRAASPGSHGGAEQLTPRSKVKALLASLDDDSEDQSPQKSRTARVDVSKTTDQPPKAPQPIPPVQDESDSDEEEVIVPRGKLTARLHAQISEDAIRDASVSSEDAQDTYSRIRKQLLEKPSVNTTTMVENGNEGEVADKSPKYVRRFLKRKKQVPERNQEPTQESSIPRSPMGHPDSDQGVEAIDSSQSPNRIGEPSVVGHNELHGSDSDPPVDILKNDRFQALVARKREERKAREAAEEAKWAEKEAMRASAKISRGSVVSEISEVDTGDEDEEAGRRLTQRSRPTRKAGKKALEEMHRETQRISRNMQLTHEAKTRKKITKESFLERFKVKRSIPTALVQASSSTVNSSAPTSDVEGLREKHTPPTSPDQSAVTKSKLSLVPETSLIAPMDDGDEPPDLENALKSQRVDKGKGKAPELCFEEIHPSTLMDHEDSLITMAASEPPTRRRELTQRPIKLRPPKVPIRPEGYGDDSDSDLEIIPSNKSAPARVDVFNRLPTKKATEDKSLITLRALAHLSSPSKKRLGSGKPSMNSNELGATLRRKARQQAARERADKIEDLRRKGVIIQTSEERQKDQLAIEDMLEKARQEVQELTKKEKEAAKKERRENGDDDGSDSSDDEDFVDEQDIEDVELSGSEEDEEGDCESEVDDQHDENDEIEEDRNKEEAPKGLFNDAASEATGEESEENGDGEEGEPQSEPETMITHHQRRKKYTTILDDDDDDEEEEETAEQSGSAIEPASSATVANPFGSQVGIAAAPMGLTQAFNATMADSQIGEQPMQTQGDSLDQLRAMTAPDFPDLELDSIVQDTPTNATAPLDIDLHFTQTQLAMDSLPLEPLMTTATQLSEIPDPTQDAGFEKSSPILSRFVVPPPSTIDTVIISPKQVQESVASKRRGRLRRRKEAIAIFSDEEDGPHSDAQSGSEKEQEDAFAIPAQAFDILKNGAKKAKKREDRFNKQKSNAKEMVEEQAVESEDEYAGLGGASDDSEGEEDEEVKKMIDEADVDVDERKLAAYFADKNRADDEAAISKLYKDINSGALRRKRGAGADFDDLDDSDDDAEARQRRKRREFARMRKALLDGDSNVIKIAEDPRKLAFLKAIEDRDDFGEDTGFLDSTPKEDGEEEEIQDMVPDSQAENKPPTMALKRKRAEPRGEQMLPPAKKSNSSTNAIANRRTHASIARKPATLAEIRASVSFLIEEPHGLNESVGPSIFDASSDIEMEDTGAGDTEDVLPGAEPPQSIPQHKNPRRTGPRTTTPAFIDRLSLKRQESSKETSTSDGRLAFVDPRSASNAIFKAPSLLRKATSSFSAFSGQDEHGISTNTNARKAAVEAEVKGRGVSGAGSKKSSVNWYAREAERKKALEKKIGKNKGASSRASSVKKGGKLSGLLGSGGAWE